MNSFALISAAPMTPSLIVVGLVTLLFRVSTIFIVHCVPVASLKSMAFLWIVSNTFFASPGFTIAEIFIGSIPGIFIVIVSVPALKLGYNATYNSPSWMTKLFDLTNAVCVFVLLFLLMVFSTTLPGCKNHSLLVMLATVSNLCPLLSWTVIRSDGILSG